jgi:hypothetical protein
MNLLIGPGNWTPETEALIASALEDGELPEIKQQVRNGAALFAVKYGEEIVAAFVLRLDQFAGYTEGVVVAGAGELHGVDLTASILPEIEKRFVGCDSIRMHTRLPALARKLRRQGYAAGEIVLKKRLNNGR